MANVAPDSTQASFTIRCTGEERQRWHRYAKSRGKSLSEVIRENLSNRMLLADGDVEPIDLSNLTTDELRQTRSIIEAELSARYNDDYRRILGDIEERLSELYDEHGEAWMAESLSELRALREQDAI